jgi:hypothetical protein
MSNLNPEKAFEYLLNVMKDNTSHFFKWITLYISLQSGIITAIGVLLGLSSTPKSNLRELIIIMFSCFAIIFSFLIISILLRNRFWYEQYVKSASKIEGPDPNIFYSNLRGPGFKISIALRIINWVIVLGWLLFISIFIINMP